MDTKLERLLETYEALYLALEPHLKALQELENQATELKKYLHANYPEGKKRFEHGRLVVLMSAPSTRVTWDDKGLLAECQARPELIHYRKTTLSKPAITVRTAPLVPEEPPDILVDFGETHA